MKYLYIIIFLMLSLSATARDLTLEQKLMDYNQLLNTMKVGFGPYYYKIDNGYVDYNKVVATYEEKIRLTQANAEFYYLIVQFIAEFKDGHFRARVPTNFKANIPIQTDWVDGKILIVGVDRDKISEDDFPYVVGDEIVEFNGKPVMQEIKEIESYIPAGFELSRVKRAAWYLLHRHGKYVPVPAGEVNLKIRRGTSAIIEPINLQWEFEGEPLDEDLFADVRAASGRGAWFSLNKLDYGLIASPDLFAKKTDSDFKCNGGVRASIPEEATMITEVGDDPFTSYYYPTEKGNVGYLRIPHYYPGLGDEKIDFKQEAEKWFYAYEYAVQELEKNTVALIIDQDHNCGGSVTFLEKMLGLFLGQPYQPLQFQFLANKGDIVELKKYLNDELKSHSVNKSGIEEMLEILNTVWAESNEFLTPKTSFQGSNKYYPNAIRYTRPIVMLIDETSGSGGDAFPAMMQGNGRATLLGTRTAGLGGHVEGQLPLMNSYIQYDMTKSLFFHPDGTAIENNGAAVDIAYTITREDVMYGFKDYQKFYTEKVLELVNSKEYVVD